MTEIEIGPQSQTSTHGIGPGDSFGGSVAILWTQFFVERFKLVSRVRVEPTEGGSNPHTQAYLLARELHGQGDGLVTDAVHWALNMAGCRYIAEARLQAEQAAFLARNLEEAGRI